MSYDSLIETEVVGDFLVELHYDSDGANNPREWDTLGTITQCARMRNFEITDKGASWYSRDADMLKEYFKDNTVFALPLDICHYGANGVRIRVGEFDPSYEWADLSTIDGFIYVEADKIMKEYSLSDPETAMMHATMVTEHVYDESVPPKLVTCSIAQVLKGEIETYVSYLNGEVYGYIVRKAVRDEDGEIDKDDRSGEEVDSCWGFVGDRDYCFAEGRSQAEWSTNKRKVEDKRAEWMMAL